MESTLDEANRFLRTCLQSDWGYEYLSGNSAVISSIRPLVRWCLWTALLAGLLFASTLTFAAPGSYSGTYDVEGGPINMQVIYYQLIAAMVVALIIMRIDKEEGKPWFEFAPFLVMTFLSFFTLVIVIQIAMVAVLIIPIYIAYKIFKAFGTGKPNSSQTLEPTPPPCPPQENKTPDSPESKKPAFEQSNNTIHAEKIEHSTIDVEERNRTQNRISRLRSEIDRQNNSRWGGKSVCQCGADLKSPPGYKGTIRCDECGRLTRI